MRTKIKKVKAANMWCLSTWEETKTGQIQKQQWFITEDEAKKAQSELNEA
jgi:hypothetical protein